MIDDVIADDALAMLPEFIEESEGYLQVLNDGMLKAEAAVRHSSQMAAADVNGMFRAMHTIKGTASGIGLKNVVMLTHRAESLLQKLREGGLPFSLPVVEALFAVLDKLDAMLNRLKGHKLDDVEIADEVGRIDSILAVQGQKSVLNVDLPQAGEGERPDIAPVGKAMDKCAIKAILEKKIEEARRLGVKASPAITQVPSGQKRLPHGQSEDLLSQEKATVPIEISTIKIDARKLDKLMNLSGELVIIRSRFARLSGFFNNDLARHKDVLRHAEQLSTLLTDIDKVMLPLSSGGVEDISKVCKITDMIRLVLRALLEQIDQGDVPRHIHALSDITGELEKTASDLQAGIMQSRMVPVEGVFTRFKRIVRDIARDMDKEVALSIEGAETELDKKIVDSLADPLTHMIRNAVDHGIEDRATRLRTGKSPVGTIQLKASHKGNSICIAIADDGRGMDPETIALVAVNKGIITKHQALTMTDKEKLGLIFLPGFSTADKVTGISGRGVGMDVVKSMVASFNGEVDIHSSVGHGTTFILKIPLTLAIIQALLVVIGGQAYALPIDTVVEIIKVSSKDFYLVDGNPMVKLRDHALSFIELAKVIKVKPNAAQHEDGKRIVIITDGHVRLGILVDALIGKEEIVIKSFTCHFSKVNGISGASILADGDIALILDPAVIIRETIPRIL